MDKTWPRVASAANLGPEHFQTLIELAPDAMLVVDATGQIVLANAEAERMFGFPRSEFAKMVVEDLIPQRFRGQHVGHRARYHQAPRVRPMGAGLELYAVRKDGREFPVEISLGPIQTASGTLVVTNVRDITQRRRFEEELEASRRQLAVTEKLAALGTLVAGVGHEVRTPLTYIATNLALIKMQVAKAVERHPDLKDLQANVDRYVDKGQDGVRRIDRIVQQLRQVAKSELLVENTGLDDVVATAVDLFRSTHKGGIEVRLDADEFPPHPMDRGQIQQVLINLLNNGAEAMGQDGLIEVRVRRKPTEAVIEVQDHGPGIAPEVQRRLWDPFFTTKPTGTGLGLPISRRIIEAHRGTMGFTTGPKGTTFTVTLPFKEATT